MAATTTPTHGKYAAIYRWRPGGFQGVGLNDVTWGTAYTDADTAYFEVEIDSEGGGTAGVDTFQWRKNGGAWTTDVDITGAAQTLSDAQTVTFAATTGHTLADKWTIVNLLAEPTTESTNQAQITDTTFRLLNPNSPPTFTDSGGEVVLQTNFTTGTAIFSGAVSTVTVAGNDGAVLKANLEVVGYLLNWKFTTTLDMADRSSCQQHWKTALPGQASANGEAAAIFIGGESFFDALQAAADGTAPYFYIELYNYDPSNDGTGDHFRAWATIQGVSTDCQVGAVVQESITFQFHGAPSYYAMS